MDRSKKINFVGGYVELYVPLPPIYKEDKWELKVYGKVIASDKTTEAEGKKILFDKGFTTNGAKINEYYRTVEILVNL